MLETKTESVITTMVVNAVTADSTTAREYVTDVLVIDVVGAAGEADGILDASRLPDTSASCSSLMLIVSLTRGRRTS